MRWILLTVLPLSIVACSEPEMSEAERQAVVDEVKAAQIVPAQSVAPQSIAFADIEAADLFGASCSFLRGEGEGERELLFIGMDDVGAIKLGGEMQRMAPDKGAGRLPYLAWEKYDGTTHTARVTMDAASGSASGEETTDYPGTLTIRDGRDRVVFQEVGTVQCGA